MGLELLPLCDRCGTALRPNAEALICSYECTFCPSCAVQLQLRCPNCGGELVPRPRRVIE